MIPARILLVIVMVSLACREATSPPPEAAIPPTTSPGGLRPLTSRDGPETTRGADSEGLPPDHPPITSGPAVSAGEGLSGTATVAPGLASRVQPTDVLYLIARNAKTNTVVAVRREDGVRFPFRFRLTAADVMMEGTPFVGPFHVTARLSRTGDAIPAKGDLEGTVNDVAAGASDLSITLVSVRQ